MTLTMADSITPANLPGGYDSYLGYVDGMWPTSTPLRLRFPGARVIALTVLGGDHIADGCDIENGDLSPASGAAWIAKRLAAGAVRPVVYASVSVMATVLGELARLNVARASVRLLTAHYGTGAHICGPASCNLIYRVMDGTQWTDSATERLGGPKFDSSLLQNDFFGITPPPHPSEASVEISKVPPGDWAGPVVLVGKGADGNLWETKWTGAAWTEPVKQ